ncbi:RHS repeat-associated core domain-containing protein [Catenulispora sp. NF23]|uniref:RHS repeat domain-containing protein n=1 Tax=Catenulispora pinistramenti TaxID=2705254 RepID=UPI001BA5383E|nr:RHS repeat-associated core domain-containing protein [Catenulispora pinistramenti]MBS2531646.1 RHS repeat-associated core domain-containing protein [Catenulispora pinistramenti]
MGSVVALMAPVLVATAVFATAPATSASEASVPSGGHWVTVTVGKKVQKVWVPRQVEDLPQVSVGNGRPRVPGQKQVMPTESTLPAAWPKAASVDIDVAQATSAVSHRESAPVDLALPVTVKAVASVAAARTAATGPAANAAAPLSTVRVTVADHAAAQAAGITGILASVARTDGGTNAAAVDVTVSYASILGEYGGDFGDRLRLVALPACALTTPTVAACRVQTPVKFTNDLAGKELTATVEFSAEQAPHVAESATADTTAGSAAAPMVLAATSSSSGQAGNYAATPIKASDGWSDNTGDNAGSFDWNYPITTPPSIGGSAPSLALNYDSASVDGRTTAENGQVSTVGEGWDVTGVGSAITRSLRPCAQTTPSISTSWPSSGDSCLGTPNASIVGGSHSGDLVRDDSDTTTPGGLWRIQSDGGSRVQLMYGAAQWNGTADGAYWQVTDPDGTIWLYGADKLPAAYGGNGHDAPTYSAWAEPVFGQGSALSGACNDPTTADPKSCMGAWRWNLSFKIDPHGNITRYAYTRELNGYQHYSTTALLNAPASYTRGGWLREVDYGWRTPDLAASTGLLVDGNTVGPKPAATILFDMAARCLTSSCPASPVTSTGGLADTGITWGSGGNYSSFSDTPGDQYCDYQSSTACPSGNSSPTFWTTARLAGIRTAVAAGGFTPNAGQQEPGTPAGYVSVDTYKFTEQFPALTHPGGCNGCTRPNLWLAQIDHTGYTTNADLNGNPGGSTVAAAMPSVFTYGNDALPNRAAISPLISQGVLDRYRLYEITNELGSEIAVSYGTGNPGGAGFDCSSAPTPATNATLCFPEYSPNPSGGDQVLDWFYKYLVTQVTEYDNTGVSSTRNTVFTYLGTPAWHTDDSEQVQTKYRTYDQFRGFSQVQAVTGSEAPGKNHMTLTTYFRGMDADPSLPVTVTSSTHPTLAMRDDNALAGQVFETEDFASDASATTDTPISDVISMPTDPRLIITASHTRSPAPPAPGSGLPIQNAHFSHTAKKYTYTASAVAPGGVRKTEIDYKYLDGSSGMSLPNFNGNGSGNNGELYLTDDLGDNSGSGAGDGTVPEQCTFSTYATAGSGDRLEWTSYPASTAASLVPKGGSCTPSSWTAATSISQSQTLYDGAPFGSLPGPGDVTAARAADSFNSTGNPNWTTTSTSMSGADTGHDAYGRATRATDALGRTTTTTYSPASGTLPSQVTATNPAGWTSSTVLDQGRGLTLHTRDVNGQTSDEDYDGLGRAAAAWVPGHSKAANYNTPSYRFDDHLFGTLPKRVTSGLPQNILSNNAFTHTATLRDDGSYANSYVILDGYGESVQTQTVTADDSAGRVIADTAYDTLGRVIETVPAFPADGSPSSTWTNWPVSPPSVSTTTYDGQDRSLVASVYATDPKGNRLPIAATSTSYTGTDRVDTTPPAGGTATTTIDDARGRSWQLWQYTAGGIPTGAHDTTIYTYGYSQDPVLGAQATKTVTDPANNTWTTTTDMLGRTTSSQDPDTGTTVTAYDNAGDVIGTADGNGQVLALSYGTAASDPLLRKAGEYNGGTITNYAGLNIADKTNALSAALSTAIAGTNQLAGYTYDKSVTGGAVPNGLGQPTASTRYTAGASGPAYITGVTPNLGFDAVGKPLGTFVTIPSGDGNGALSGTYSTNNYYTPATEQIDHVDLPTPNGFAPETVYNTYNVNGLLLSSAGNANYVSYTNYNQLGQQLTRTLGDYPYGLTQTQLYDPATQRVVKSFLDGTAGQTNGVINQYGVDYNTYTYNAAGQITAINDLQNANQPAGYSSGAQTTDLQCFTYDAEGRLTTAWSDNGGTTPAATPILNDANGAGPAPGGIGSCTNSAPTNAAAGKNQSTGGPAPYWQTFAVDAAGNRTTMTDHDVTSGTTAGDSTRNYSYKNSTGGQPHTLTQVSTTTAGAATPTSYTYDAAGNTKTRPGTTAQGEQLTWDPEGRLQHVDDNGATTDYVYDAAGNQLLRRDSINHTTSLYLGTLELHLNNATDTVSGNRYYTYPGAPTMVADQTGKITYEAGNTQGTALTTIDAATGKVTARRYTTPYDTPRGTVAPQWPDDHTFLGKTTDALTGLVDVGARKYDPLTGRFISADPVFQPTNPEAVGGYAYAGNDPIDNSDPTGLRWADTSNPAATQHNDPQPHQQDCAYGAADDGSCNPSPSERQLEQQSYLDQTLLDAVTHWTAAHTRVIHQGNGCTSSWSNFGSCMWNGAKATGGAIVDNAGPILEHAGESALGIAGMMGGASTDAAGGGLCLTGIGCLAGAPAIAAGTSLAVGGGVLTYKGATGLGDDLNKMYNEASQNADGGPPRNKTEVVLGKQVPFPKDLVPPGQTPNGWGNTLWGAQPGGANAFLSRTAQDWRDLGITADSATRLREFYADQYARSLWRGQVNQSAGERFELMQDAIVKLTGSGS